MNEAMEERLAIRELVENWVVWRDAGDWAPFRSVWHDDGRMMATWFQGGADEFIRVSREGWDKGVSILHFLGGSAIDEKDRLDPVDPAAELALDRGLLDAFPEGYRHLAYLQTRIGFEVKRDMPGLKGAAVQALYARGAAWLAGGLHGG